MGSIVVVQVLITSKFSTNEKDNFSKKRDSIYQFVDGIFSANENDKKHFIGENEDVEKRYGELKSAEELLDMFHSIKWDLGASYFVLD